MNKKLIASSVLTLLALPAVILAFNPGPVPVQHTFSEILDGIIAVLWPAAAAIGAVVFFFAAFTFLTANGDPEKIKVARDTLIWAAVGVIVAVIAISIPTIVRTLSGL